MCEYFEAEPRPLWSAIIIVIWEWEWLTDSTGNSDNGSDEDEAQGHFNPYIQSEEEEEEDASASETTPSLMHFVMFKCMGSTYDLHAREALKKASRLLQEGDDVPVRAVPESGNKFNAKAIAFLC